MQETLRLIQSLMTLGEEALATIDTGLAPIPLSTDDAMLTALVLRWDLMNQRGFLADDWRAIKFAADELKAILDLNASHLISTRRDVNRVFDFTFDESLTRLSASLDTPLNRRSERNVFRNSLINYQATLRGTMALEDDIKLDVRNSLRDLELDNQQYGIAVASAALAFERVVSVELDLLRFGEASVRDYLEAQEAFVNSLRAVAALRVAYILDRISLFIDLELLQTG